MIANHYASKLSELDKQIISHVPEGGNWKNIPNSVPSKRLEQIRQSYLEGKGSRSTYYGRLTSTLPSYTINTYFNRPGNGCHIHYNQDRTMSQREAARLQSFPDNFIFEGSITSIYKQIGNAVPPLLAYQIAENIPFKGTFVDLFCGAGGLALGFIWSGWKPIVSNDIDANAIKTHKSNIDSTTILGDINDDDTFERIVKACNDARANYPDLPLFIIGGPPCQGFSTANRYTNKVDQRNFLFKSYAKLIERIEPDGFVFENVRGMLNLEKGKFFEMIKEDLGRNVEKIEVFKYNSAEYAVPQRRERVFVIGGDNELFGELEIKKLTQVPKEGHPQKLPKAISVEDALGDLPEIMPSEDGINKEYKFEPATDYQRLMRGFITSQQYIDKLSK